MRKSVFWIVICSLFLIAAGCTGQPNNGEKSADTGSNVKDQAVQANQSQEPVTIKFYGQSTQFSEETFQKLVAEPLKKKQPNITLEYVTVTPADLPNKIASGESPDIVVSWPSGIPDILNLGMDTNIEGLIKQSNFDLSKINSVMLDTIKLVSQTEYLIGLPAFNNSFALYYNNDLFNKFGVEKPKDNMKWDDVRSLAVKMTRTDNGMQYRGIFPDNPIRAIDQLDLVRIDLKTGTAQLTSDGFVDVFRLWQSLLSIPGNFDAPNNNLGINYHQQSFQKGELAMLTGWSTMLNDFLKLQSIDWDMVTYPINPKAPGIGQRVDIPIMAITRQSKHKEEAFKVILSILSEETQTELAKLANGPVLVDKKISDQFGKGIPGLEKKNVQAFVSLKLNTMHSMGNVSGAKFNPIFNNAFMSVMNKKKDINTALRDANEELNQVIQELK
ncbi:MAG: transporter substrate-binding protein [Paenibacillaceae bacterium]|nr:transporter substrate-binding protein [Paenibacillaceae bacterium]